MIAQAKLLRVLKLIALLKSKSKSIDELANSLETTPRTIYRYIDLLEEVGFIVDKDWHNRYFIHTTEEEQKDTLAFTAEEAHLIQDLVRGGFGKNPMKDSILKKLFVHSDLDHLSSSLLKARLGKLVNQLGDALKYEQQVVLKNYHSAHSGEIRDRLVEPIGFSQNYDTLVAFEVHDRKNKSFKIERIGEVQTLNKGFKHQKLHKMPQSDIFGISSGDTVEVILKMSLRAYLLMREEYPLSVSYLTKDDDAYVFKGPVKGFSGISRFILGLLQEIEVIGPESLKHYLNKILQDKKF